MFHIVAPGHPYHQNCLTGSEQKPRKLLIYRVLKIDSVARTATKR